PTTTAGAAWAARSWCWAAWPCSSPRAFTSGRTSGATCGFATCRGYPSWRQSRNFADTPPQDVGGHDVGAGMHELSIALGIVDVAAEEAERHGAIRVVAVRLRLGPLAGVVKEALLSAYELAREGTPLEGSRLDVEEMPLVAYCPACAAER